MSNLTIKLRSIYPVVPEDAAEVEGLNADLKRMGCYGFRKVAWDIRDEAMAREVLDGASNEFDHTIRAKSGK